MAPINDRRRFTRIPFDADVELATNGRRWSTRLLDISLMGMMVSRPADWPDTGTQRVTATIKAPDHAFVLTLQVTTEHVEAERIGFACREIDLDSATHLRRLIELNLGEPGMLYREFSELCS